MKADLTLHIQSKSIQSTVRPLTWSAAGKVFLKATPSNCLSFPGAAEKVGVCPLSFPRTSTQHNPLLALLCLLPQFCQFRLLDLAASLLTLESSNDFPQPKKMVCTPNAGDIETATQHAYPISIFHLCLGTLILSLEATALKR